MAYAYLTSFFETDPRKGLSEDTTTTIENGAKVIVGHIKNRKNNGENFTRFDMCCKGDMRNLTALDKTIESQNPGYSAKVEDMGSGGHHPAELSVFLEPGNSHRFHRSSTFIDGDHLENLCPERFEDPLSRNGHDLQM